MDFLKKMFRDKQSKKNISFFSTDNNVLCEDGNYLRKNISNMNDKITDITGNITNINSQLNVLNNRFTLQDWELVKHDILPTDVTTVSLTQNNKGDSFLYNEVMVFFKVPKLSEKKIFKLMKGTLTDNSDTLMSDNSFGDVTREKYIRYNIAIGADTVHATRYMGNATTYVLNVSFGSDLVSNVWKPGSCNVKKVDKLFLVFNTAIDNLEFWVYGR